jgi:methionyl aminopeptidase
MVAPGVTTAELDEYAHKLIKEGGDTPAFLNYKPEGHHRAFPASLCTSVNNEVVHGIPNKKRVLKEGWIEMKKRENVSYQSNHYIIKRDGEFI